MPFNFPILLTWLRVALIPLVVGVFYLPDTMLSPFDTAKHCSHCAIFIVAAITDWVDGFLARRLGNQTSAFGAFLRSGCRQIDGRRRTCLYWCSSNRVNAIHEHSLSLAKRNCNLRAARMDGDTLARLEVGCSEFPRQDQRP